MEHVTHYLLIGGGLASSRAAHQIRKHDPAGTITLVSDEPHAPYDRPPLSKEFLRKDRAQEQLYFDSPEELERERIGLLLDRTVERLDPHSATASLSDGTAISFDKALIATGGRPARIDLPGQNLSGVHYLRTIDDAAAIVEHIRPGTRVAIIGGGFIGVEAAAALTQLQARVAVIEAAPRLWSRFAPAALSSFLEEHCRDRGISIHTGETVSEIRGTSKVRSIVTEHGSEHHCELLLVSVGLVPNTELAEAAGLEADNGILVNERMRTSHQDIYAAGDVINYPDPIFNKRRRVEHWGHAEHSGQIAGQNMAGVDATYSMLTYVWSDVFDLHLEFAGDETEHEQTVTRGEMDGHSFTLLYLKDGTLRAYFSVNGKPREFAPLQKLIRRKVDLAGKEGILSDPGAPLKDLL